MQYLAAIAIVEAVRTKPGYELLPLHIKWPNDIYAVDPASGKLNKVGGILASTVYTKDSCNVIVGKCSLRSSLTCLQALALTLPTLTQPHVSMTWWSS